MEPRLTRDKLLESVNEISRSPVKVYSALEDFKEILIEERKKTTPRGLIVDVNTSAPSRIIVFGDIHGDLDTMLELLDRSGSFSELEKDAKVVFLGDYIDRGPKQIETLLAIYLIKKEYGDKVVTLRGNHEPPDYLPVNPHDYPYQLKARYGNVDGERIYGVSKEVFDLLPHAYIVEGKAVFLHGGIPVFRTKECGGDYRCILDVGPHPSKVLEEILWNDPVDDEEIEFTPSPRGAGYLWGPLLTDEFVSKTNVKIIVRGHEPVWSGYKFNHNNRVATIFSRKGSPYYNAYASVMILDVEDLRYEILTI